MNKVTATLAAEELLEILKEHHGNLIFIHSEGCCDGTSPILMTADDFYLGSNDEKIGEILGVPYYMHTSNFPYWEHLQILIDVVDGMGNSFSLESTKDKSFIIKAQK